MILPLWMRLAAGAGLVVVGAWGGYTVCDWQHDSADLKELKQATADVKKETTRLKDAGDKLEESRATERASSTVRESTINTIYKDRVVRADCALDPAAGSVLDDAIKAANARASGQPVSAVPADRPSP